MSSGDRRIRLPVLPSSLAEDENGLPPLAARWLREAVGPLPPREVGATCDDCCMTAADDDHHDVVGFLPDVKCCTYHPFVPNFLIGAALTDHSKAGAAGRSILRGRIASGDGVSPLGIGPGRVEDLLSESESETFGRARALRCPYYVDGPRGNCSIWRFRDGICATWFCKHTRGGVGRTYWAAAARFLLAVDRALARHALVTLDPGAEALAIAFAPAPTTRRLVSADLDRRADPATARRLWGRYYGHEEPFFSDCWQVIAPLKWADVARIGGAEVEALRRVAKATCASLETREIPPRLRLAVLSVKAEAQQHYIVSYSAYDPLSLPAKVAAALARFDGRPVAEVRKEIARLDGLTLDDTLLRKLVEFEVLQPVE